MLLLFVVSLSLWRKEHCSTMNSLNYQCNFALRFFCIWFEYYILLSFPPNKITLPSRWVVRWNPVIGFGSFDPFSQTPVAGSNIYRKCLNVHHTGDGCCLLIKYIGLIMNIICLPQHCPANILFHFYPSLLLR